LGNERRKEVVGACEKLGITRKDRCIVAENRFYNYLKKLILEHYKMIQNYGGILISLKI
jgi:hypothetical protein